MNTDLRALTRLMAWLSPAFPVGSFGYSHGLEQAVAEGRVRGGDSLFDWLSALLEHGSGWNDAVLLRAAWDDPEEAAELALALCPSMERRRETRDQGAAFLAAARQWGEALGVAGSAPAEAPYPVAVGLCAAEARLPPAEVLAAYLHAFASNLVSIGLRVVPLGQSTGVAVLARLEPVVLGVADRAATSSLDDLGGAVMISDILSMRHETLATRLFIT